MERAPTDRASKDGYSSVRSDGLHQVGVVFVHGIGEQDRGATLTGFGESFFETLVDGLDGAHAKWAVLGIDGPKLSDWVESLGDVGLYFSDRQDETEEEPNPRPLKAVADLALHPNPPVQDLSVSEAAELLGVGPDDALATIAAISSSKLEDPQRSSPAHSEVVITRVNLDGQASESTWLLAESWWADVFRPPSYRQVMKWSGTVLPRTLGSHFAAAMLRRLSLWRDTAVYRKPLLALRIVAAAAAFLISPLVATMAFLVLAVLSLPAIIPIAAIREAAASSQRMLASVLGDSFILLASPIQAGAIRERVARDIEWAARRCHNLIVVAHSQGAAIAYEVIRDRAPDRLGRLITLGSGVRKLEELRAVLRHPGRTGAAVSVSGVLLTAFGILSLISIGLDVTAVISTVLGALFMFFGMAPWLRARVPFNLWVSEIESAGFGWDDYWASADPVPNGPITDVIEAGFITTHEIRNRDSLARDHTSYWTNTEEFVLPVVQTVATFDPIVGGLLSVEPERVASGRKARRIRVAVLAWGRRIMWISLVGLGIIRFGELLSMLRRGFDALGLSSFDAGAVSSDEWQAVVGLGAVIGGYAAGRTFWTIRDRTMRRRYVRRDIGGEHRLQNVFQGMLFAAPAAAAIIASGFGTTRTVIGIAYFVPALLIAVALDQAADA